MKAYSLDLRQRIFSYSLAPMSLFFRHSDENTLPHKRREGGR
jgi:hypothetical protein